MMCVKYLMDIRKKVSMSLWTLIAGILRFNIFLVVALYMVPHILAIIGIGVKTVHPCHNLIQLLLVVPF